MGASRPDLLPGPQLVSSVCLRWIITKVGHWHSCKPGSRLPSSWPRWKGWEVAAVLGEGCKVLWSRCNLAVGLRRDEYTAGGKPHCFALAAQPRAIPLKSVSDTTDQCNKPFT